VGAVVSDFRAEGSLALLNSLVRYQGGLDPAILSSMLDMRELFEVETARRAAANRTDDQAQGLLVHVDREDQTDPADVDRITRIDFEFHHRVALASNNVMYPMLIQSFREVYLHLAGLFFKDHGMAARVFGWHRLLALAIGRKDEDQAAKEMKKLLDHGRDRLVAALGKEKNR
jgi:DNA-binding FadR family transcriptional regulator